MVLATDCFVHFNPPEEDTPLAEVNSDMPKYLLTPSEKSSDFASITEFPTNKKIDSTPSKFTILVAPPLLLFSKEK